MGMQSFEGSPSSLALRIQEELGVGGEPEEPQILLCTQASPADPRPTHVCTGDTRLPSQHGPPGATCMVETTSALSQGHHTLTHSRIWSKWG